MESHNKCSDTTGANTPRTSKKAAKEQKFTLLDLSRLTFRLENAQAEHDVETASVDIFRTFVRTVADVSDVGTAPWTLEQRRDFVNALWLFCRDEGEDFPLQIINEKINADGDEKLTNRA